MTSDEHRPRPHKDFRLGQKVIVQDTNKRTTLNIKGQTAVVVDLPGNGWVMCKLPSAPEPLRIQQRYLCHAPSDADAASAMPKPVSAADVAMPARPLKVRITAPGDAKATSGSAADVGGVATPATRGDGGGQPLTPAHTPGLLREILRKLRADMMEAESHVPWNAVRSMWRARRAKWRQATKAAELVTDLAQRLAEFRGALVTDSVSFLGCGPSWQQALDTCTSGGGTHAMLLRLWEELRCAIATWLAARSRPMAQQSAALQAGTTRAVAALHKAAALGQDALAQVPLEAILNNSVDGLQAVRAIIERDRKATASKLAELNSNPRAGRGDATPPPCNSPYSPGALLAAAASGFDSGAETDCAAGSAATDMNSSDSD